MKKILAVIILGLGLSGCAGMELSSVSVGVSSGYHGHYGHYRHHYYPNYYYAPPPVVVYRQRVVVRPQPQRHVHGPSCNHRQDRRHDRNRHRN